MATNIAFSGVDRRQPRVRPALAAEYKQAHEHMLDAIGAMDELSLGPVPSQLRVSHTRLRITRAGSESRAAYRRIIAILMESPDTIVTDAVESVQRLHFQLTELSRRHMTTWTHDQACADWEGYCRSSAEVRQLWRESIDRERRLIYPLL